jgi:hypothetical protein
VRSSLNVAAQFGPRIATASDDDGRLGWRLFIAQQRALLDTASRCLAVHRAVLLTRFRRLLSGEPDFDKTAGSAAYGER